MKRDWEGGYTSPALGFTGGATARGSQAEGQLRILEASFQVIATFSKNQLSRFHFLLGEWQLASFLVTCTVSDTDDD